MTLSMLAYPTRFLLFSMTIIFCASRRTVIQPLYSVENMYSTVIEDTLV